MKLTEVLAYLALGLVSLSTSIAGEIPYMSVELFETLEKRENNKLEGSEYVNVYLSGTMIAYVFANADLIQRKQKPLFCQPSNLALGHSNLKQLIKGYLEKDRATRTKADFEVLRKKTHIGVVALLALQETFPCK